MFARAIGVGALALFLSALMASYAAAFTVQLRVDQSNDDLNETLKNASLVVALQSRDGVGVQDILASAQADYERILTALYQNAYYGPVVSIKLDGREASDLSLFSAPSSVRNVVISVQSGRKFRFGKASIGPIAAGTVLPVEFARDQPAKVGVLRDAVDAGIKQWREEGHAKAALADQVIVANHKDARLDADIRLKPGPQLRFGQLTVTGKSNVRVERLHAMAGFPTGQVFSTTQARLVTERLRRTGTFKTVVFTEAENIGPNDTLDATVQVSDALPRRFGAGAEVSSLEGVTLSTYWLHRNLFGGAERLRIEGEVSRIGGQESGVDYSLSLRFDRPATFNQDTDFYIETELESVNETDLASDTFSIEAGIKRFASENRTYTFGLGYQYSDVTDVFGNRSYSILTFPATATFDYRDDILNTKSGFYGFANITPFAALTGTEHGVLGQLDARIYKTVGSAQRLTFAARGQLGTVIGPDLSNAPSDYLFYSGGGGSVRGQQYQSLSVDLGGGNSIGGRSFAGFSGEARYQIGEKIGLVGFYDAGYVGASSAPFSGDGQWHSGAGLGIRYDTGIGPIRLDVAVPVSGPGTNSGLEIYIGIGQSF